MISIIIPVLNEADTISRLLTHLIDNSSPKNISEIIVVDGGSTDGTLDILKPDRFLKPDRSVIESMTPNVLDTKFQKQNFTRTDVQLGSEIGDPESSSGWHIQSKILLLESSKGRAKQMNLGAKHAKGEVLYFLHADSFPPIDFDQLIINEIQKGNQAGCFRMQFDSKHWWLRLASWLTQFSWRASRGGDQSQFITKTLFNDIGGYNENYIIYEDNILINELYARNEFTVINKKLTTSARLYRKHGVWKLQYHFWTIYVKKWFGASADELLAYYKKHVC
ncbi:glycosyltransferase family 2 protein [Winogradskyella sp. F6397]|uniref:Glycosyltransferase family 2 protein n=1 Tax=Winogradskyella marina TaxID=2785530 RepID=A0ABS0EDY4_9FLAO|nr:glycosyltransferase family 2 protein [Winogradskyella marina]MBF8148658.1 glycosyltransferase family 2 protein [Winogradskyella marina]